MDGDRGMRVRADRHPPPAPGRRRRPGRPRLATSRATTSADRLAAEPPETKQPPAACRKTGPVRDQPQHLVLGVDRARGLQPGDALDRRAGDQHVEQQRRLGRRGRDEAEEPGAVRRDHRGGQARGVHAEHLVRVVRQVAEQAPHGEVELGRVAGALVQRDRVKPQPVLRVREHRPDHLLRGGIDTVHARDTLHGRNVARQAWEVPGRPLCAAVQALCGSRARSGSRDERTRSPAVRTSTMAMAMKISPSVMAARLTWLRDGPAHDLGLEPVRGAVGEGGPGADDDGPEDRVWRPGPADRLAGLRAAVDREQGGGGQPAEQAGDRARDLHHQAVAVRDRLVDEQRDDHGGGDHGAQQPRRADLARRAEVGGQHRGENDAVDDHRFGELRKASCAPREVRFLLTTHHRVLRRFADRSTGWSVA